MKIYSESTSTDVGMICNFMNINIFTDIFIHFTVTNYLTKTTLRTIAHATPLISANKFWTALQKNKHCRTVKIMSRNIHHYNYCSSLARWYKWYFFLFLPGPVNIPKGKESRHFLNYSYGQTKRSRESSLIC